MLKKYILLSVVLFILRSTINGQNKLSAFRTLHINELINNDSANLSQAKINALTTLGELWAFFKYYHPSVAEGKYNWDNELLKGVDDLFACADSSFGPVLEGWAEKYPLTSFSRGRLNADTSLIKFPPAYGKLFGRSLLSHSLIEKLLTLKQAGVKERGFYHDFEPSGNVKILNENSYKEMEYPSIKYRLIALFRYWAIVNYFYPYRNLIEPQWNNTLEEMIPEFVHANNPKEYMLACLKLIGRVKDSHSNIWNSNKALEEWRGQKRVPISVRFIDNLLIVANFYDSRFKNSSHFALGDTILQIDGRKVEDIVKDYLPYLPASNLPTQLRDLAIWHIINTNKDTLQIGLARSGKIMQMAIKTLPISEINMQIEFDPDYGMPSFRSINSMIGYFNPGRFKKEEAAPLIDSFLDKKAIIVDLRCYPNVLFLDALSNFFRLNTSPFALATLPDKNLPGQFIFQKEEQTLKKSSRSKGEKFKGKIVVIVNERTKSFSEYCAMAFQKSANATIVGSTTAAADGNVSWFTLPGNIKTAISGVGIYYPDKSETQISGIKIDTEVKQSVNGIKNQTDDVLQKAIEICN